jgi:hypothetical protein
MIEETITVPYQFTEGVKTNECILEVMEHVKQHGGKVVYCWIVWEDPYWYTLLYHAIWKTPEGKLLCITPQEIHNAEGCEKILGDRKVILGAPSPLPSKHTRNGLKALPSRHIPKLKDKWCVACCNALNEEFRLTDEAEIDLNPDKIERAKEAHRVSNYWLGRGTKGRCYTPLNSWLYSFVNHLQKEKDNERTKSGIVLREVLCVAEGNGRVL